jgi:hypothetical protein
MSERDHTVIEELLSVDALGGLDDDDRDLLDRERATHGACEECARLESEFTEVAGRLGMALDPVAVPAGMADDILRDAGEDVSSEPLVIVSDDGEADAMEAAGRRERQRRPSWRGLVAVAAAFVLFVGGWAVRSAMDSGGAELAASTFVRFEGDAGDAGTLAMAYEPGRPGVVFFGSGLPDPGNGRAYEIWMIEGGEPVSGGCVRPEGGRILTFVDANIGSTEEMAVTVEAASCPDAPTTEPVLTASLA